MRGKGFSLVELVILMVAIGVVATIIFFTLKPSEVLEKSRDAQRFADMKMLIQAVNRFLAESHDFKGLTGPYSSIDAGFSSAASRQKIDGTGWLPLNFSSISSGAPFSVLPLDPLNNVNHNYRLGVSYSNKTYEINGVFESPENTPKQAADGGNNPTVYELGTDLTIL